MIKTAEEFVRLRTSEDHIEQRRSATEFLGEKLCTEIIETFPEMKVWIIHNKTVPIAILRTLAEDTDRQIRAAVASKRKLDIGLFQRLANDQDDMVRNSIVNNAKTPVDILRDLTVDAEEYIRNAAREKIKATVD